MDFPMALTIAVMYGAGTYMVLRPNLIRIVLGFGLYSNATNLLLITLGGYEHTRDAPFVHGEEHMTAAFMDPLPPDIILTAIVISFAVGALMLVLAYQVYKDNGTDNPQELPLDDDVSHAGVHVGSHPQTPHAGEKAGVDQEHRGLE
jgi:multisubunit Na+/H+ antiporter MnhC subunit